MFHRAASRCSCDVFIQFYMPSVLLKNSCSRAQGVHAPARKESLLYTQSSRLFSSDGVTRSACLDVKKCRDTPLVASIIK